MTCNCGGNTMNMPVAGVPIVGSDGVLTQTWQRFMLDTYTRTGAQGHTPTGVTVSDQIATAQGTGNTAQTTANTAVANAATAQTTANTAVANAAAAQATANAALPKNGSQAMTGPLVLPVYAVGGLPAGIVGARAMVNNALAPVWGTPVVAGGAVTVPVFFNGAAWTVG